MDQLRPIEGVKIQQDRGLFVIFVCSDHIGWSPIHGFDTWTEALAEVERLFVKT